MLALVVASHHDTSLDVREWLTEIEKPIRRLSLTKDEGEQLEAVTKALVRQILHAPVTTLCERGDCDVYVEAARTLFRLDETASLTSQSGRPRTRS